MDLCSGFLRRLFLFLLLYLLTMFSSDYIQVGAEVRMVNGFQELCTPKDGDGIGSEREAITATEFSWVTPSKVGESPKQCSNGGCCHRTHVQLVL